MSIHPGARYRSVVEVAAPTSRMVSSKSTPSVAPLATSMPIHFIWGSFYSQDCHNARPASPGVAVAKNLLKTTAGRDFELAAAGGIGIQQVSPLAAAQPRRTNLGGGGSPGCAEAMDAIRLSHGLPHVHRRKPLVPVRLGAVHDREKFLL